MNPFRKIANSLMNWWKGETAPEVSDSTELTGGVMTLNSPSFLESMGLSRKKKDNIRGDIFHMSQDAVGNACKNAYQILSENGQGNYRGRADRHLETTDQKTEPVHDTNRILEHSGNQPQSLRERLCVHEKEIHPEEIRRRGQNS